MKVAIAGTGFMGRTHTEALRRLRGVEVIGILGSSLEKSRKAAEELEIAKAYPTWETLAADKEVQAVHVTTPNRFHFPQTRDALRAGKHVMCEKPLAMTSVESNELVDLAAETGLAAGVNYNIRFYPLNLEAKRRIADGDLGKIHGVYGSYQQDWLLHDTDYNWRVRSEEQGELRAVADIGTHWIDLIQNITGQRVERVMADLQTLHPIRRRPKGEVETFAGMGEGARDLESIEITTDDLGSVLLRLDGGACGSIFVSQVTPGYKNLLRYEISGSAGSLIWSSEEPNRIRMGYREKPNEELVKDPCLMAESPGRFADYPGGHPEGYPDTFKMCFRAFYDYIAGGCRETKPEFATFEDGHREVRFCEAVLRSAKEGRWIDLKDAKGQSNPN